jgi:hypothetical protein
MEGTLPPQTSAPLVAQSTETLLHFFGLHLSLSTAVQVVAIPLALATLAFAAYQSYLSRRANEVVALQMRYQMIFETNRFIFDNPEYAHLAVSGARYNLVKPMNTNARRRQAALDLLIDNFEFYFLIGLHEEKDHANRLLQALISNPEIQAFVKSPLCGVLRKEFKKVVAKMAD